MAEKQNTPEIRFEGFTDPWEQRKLGELCTFSKGHGYSKADIRDAGTPLILYGRLYTQYESRIEEVDTFTVEQDGSILSRGNEVIVPASGETAEDIAIASSVRRSGIILGGDLNVVTPTGKLDPDYTALAITYSKAHDDLAKRAQGKSVVHVHGNDIAEVEISYPSESEQKRISSVALNLDSLITLHQRKYDKLCTVKKSMLDKMFPKLGETEPEIRFEGFTDPWEQRKLGGLFFESNERSSSMEILSVSVAKGIYPASESDRDTNPGASLANYKVVHKGDVVYNSMRMWQGAVGSSDYDGIVSPAYVVARPAIELDSTCFGYLLKRPEMLYKYLCDSQGNSKDTQTLKYNRFADIEVTMPANLEEQRVISACLGRVDTLITLHQRKLELLRNIKKSLLDRMFV
ncbi:restriction endonuclease subunit S [Collinsella sp. CLA-JM-H32B]